MPAENAGRAFALVLVEELVRHGMCRAVIAPGSRSTPVALALLENPHVEVHVRVDERSAAYLALGIAKASGDIVSVLCTSGTATSYFHGAVMEADLARVPLLVLTADRPPELHGIGANQTVEQAGLYGDAVRWAPTIGTPESGPDRVAIWRWYAKEAAGRCLGAGVGPPGPVHLNLPLRDPLTPTDDGIGFRYELGLGGAINPPFWAGSIPAPPELIQRISAARRGVIVAGGWSGGGVHHLLEFAKRSGWPILAEPHSGARSGGLRATEVLLRDPSFTDSHQPDLVMVVGRVGLSRALLSWLATVPHVVVSPDGGHWDVTRTAEAVTNCSLDQLASIDVGSADRQWTLEWIQASQRAGAAVDALLDASPTLTEPQVARDVAASVPSDGALVVASSMPIRDLDLVMRQRGSITIFANRGVSGIDGFVSTAQGVAIAREGRGPTVALCGDLSLLHDVNGLMPGPDPRPDITYVVINNDGGGIFSLLPQGSSVDPIAFERLFGTPHGMSIERVAAAYEVQHTLVSTAGELATALASYGGVRIIEIRTNRAENAALHDRLRAIRP